MSKSIVNRMLILAPETTLQMLSSQEDLCDDIKVMAHAVKTVCGTNNSQEPITIDLHASGTAMRFVSALCAVTEGTWLLTGTERLYQRPVKPLVDALKQAGARIEYQGKEGFPPLLIQCDEVPEGGKVEIDGSESSQYVSALMLVADRFRNGLDIYIKGMPSSQPYIEMTRKLIDDWKSNKTLAVEADWSAAAFWLEIKYLMKRFTDFDPEGIRLTGLKDDSIQGDRTIGQIFDEMDKCDGVFKWDFKDCPDLVQPVAVSCCMAGRPFRFTGVKNLRLKETDRLEALRRELGKMGFGIRIDEDAISLTEMRQEQWQSLTEMHKEQWQPEPVETYRDHRMAMAFAGCALRYGKVVINEPEVVEKSYPDFWENLKKAGFGIEYQSSTADTGHS